MWSRSGEIRHEKHRKQIKLSPFLKSDPPTALCQTCTVGHFFGTYFSLLDGRHDFRNEDIGSAFCYQWVNAKIQFWGLIKGTPCLLDFWQCRIELKSAQTILAGVLTLPVAVVKHKVIIIIPYIKLFSDIVYYQNVKNVITQPSGLRGPASKMSD